VVTLFATAVIAPFTFVVTCLQSVTYALFPAVLSGMACFGAFALNAIVSVHFAFVLSGATIMLVYLKTALQMCVSVLFGVFFKGQKFTSATIHACMKYSPTMAFLFADAIIMRLTTYFDAKFLFLNTHGLYKRLKAHVGSVLAPLIVLFTFFFVVIGVIFPVTFKTATFIKGKFSKKQSKEGEATQNKIIDWLFWAFVLVMGVVGFAETGAMSTIRYVSALKTVKHLAGEFIVFAKKNIKNGASPIGIPECFVARRKIRLDWKLLPEDASVADFVLIGSFLNSNPNFGLCSLETNHSGSVQDGPVLYRAFNFAPISIDWGVLRQQVPDSVCAALRRHDLALERVSIFTFDPVTDEFSRYLAFHDGNADIWSGAEEASCYGPTAMTENVCAYTKTYGKLIIIFTSIVVFGFLFYKYILPRIKKWFTQSEPEFLEDSIRTMNKELKKRTGKSLLKEAGILPYHLYPSPTPSDHVVAATPESQVAEILARNFPEPAPGIPEDVPQDVEKEGKKYGKRKVHWTKNISDSVYDQGEFFVPTDDIFEDQFPVSESSRSALSAAMQAAQEKLEALEDQPTNYDDERELFIPDRDTPLNANGTRPRTSSRRTTKHGFEIQHAPAPTSVQLAKRMRPGAHVLVRKGDRDKHVTSSYRVTGPGSKPGYVKAFSHSEQRPCEVPLKRIVEVHPVEKEALFPDSPHIPMMSDRVYNISIDRVGTKMEIGKLFSIMGVFVTAGHVISVIEKNDKYAQVNVGTIVDCYISPLDDPLNFVHYNLKLLIFNNDEESVADIAFLQPVKALGCSTAPLNSLNYMKAFDEKAMYYNGLWWSDKGKKVLTVGTSLGNYHGCSSEAGASGAPLINSATQQVIGVHTATVRSANKCIFTPLAYWVPLLEKVLNGPRLIMKSANVPGLVPWWDDVSHTVRSQPYSIDHKEMSYVTHFGFLGEAQRLSEDLYMETADQDFLSWGKVDPGVEKFRISNPTHVASNKSFLKYDQPEQWALKEHQEHFDAALRDTVAMFEPLWDRAQVRDYYMFDKQASPGYVMRHYKNCANKEQAFYHEDYNQLFWNNAHLVNYPALFSACSKTENLNIKKIMDRDLRNFIVEPWELFQYDARMNQHANELMCEAQFIENSPIKHGWSMQHGGFQRLVKMLLGKTRPKSGAGDCRKWDSKFKAFLTRICMIVRFWMWDKKGMSSDEWWKRQVYIYTQNKHSFVRLPSGQVIQKHEGQNSGHVRTTDDNCIAHIFIWCLLCRVRYGKSFATVLSEGKLAVALYADDHVFTFHEDLGLSSFSFRAQIYSACGMELKIDDDLVLDGFVGQTFLGYKATLVSGRIVPMFSAEKAFNALAKTQKICAPNIRFDRAMAYAQLMAFDRESCLLILDYMRFLQKKYPLLRQDLYTHSDMIAVWMDKE